MRNRLFREVVANLLIHREYSSAYPAKLIITADRVTTENGNNARGYGVIDLDDFSPYPKNPVIAGVFKEIGWAEELGSGVRNMKKYSQIYSGKLPKIEDGNIFRTTIFLHAGEATGEESLKTGEVKLFHDFPRSFFCGCFMAFCKSLHPVIGILLSRNEKSPQIFLRALRGYDSGMSSHIKATGTPVLCTHRKNFLKNFLDIRGKKGWNRHLLPFRAKSLALNLPFRAKSLALNLPFRAKSRG